MKRDELKTKGLTDEQIDFVMDENGKDINDFRGQLTTATQERDNLQTQVDEVTKNLADAQKNGGNSKELQAQLDKLQDDLKTAQDNGQEALTQTKLGYETELALTKAGAKNVKAAKALLDMDNIKFDKDGKIEGLNEQLEAIKTAEDTSFMFATAEVSPEQPGKPSIVHPGNPAGDGDSGEVDPFAAIVASYQ
ncbi:scaffolding protein [Periweissella cryptocerci]|uniref:Scaffolding protein n=1 Tax=Periweissella cryptocerci TaxID=2506420 RepID=A0A4P6YW17_9LACO|nr:phage scaffolding protein [Periweissella cryptocerci]QBO36966.1 scaffolding protein [Periweissella cryptocerci]